MPGKSLKDFEVGQWVGIAYGGSHKNKVGKIVKIDSFIYTAFYDAYGVLETENIPMSVIHKGASAKWGSPDSLYTADETEEILYHCSYCGTEGHNRRTCPKLEGTISKDEMEYIKGDKIGIKDLKPGDLFMLGRAAHRTDIAKYWDDGVFKAKTVTPYNVLCNVVETGGHKEIGPFNREWTFDNSNWVFYRAEEVSSDRVSIKNLPIWELIDIVLPVSRLTLLYGPPGTGKTTAGNFLGNPEKVYNITLTEETPAAELRGHFVPKGQEFVWMDGPALTAFKNGSRLVLNEIDKASGDALTFCHALMDDPGIANITLPYKDEDGEPVSVKPHEGFNVVATMNGDPEDLPEALRDRFAVKLHVDKVHPDAIKSLPVGLRKIASKGISKDGERSVSIRGWNAFVQLSAIIGEENAAKAVFGDRAVTILNSIKIDSITSKEKK